MTDFAKLVMGADTRDLKSALKDLDALTQGSKKTEKQTDLLGGALKKMALQAAAAFSTLAALREIKQFQTAMAEVSTLVDTATFDLDRMRKSILAASSAFGSDATQQAKATYQIISAGASTAADATNLLTAANKLAIGGVTDVATAADGLTSVLNAYGFASERATEVSDAMFISMRAGKTTVGELSAEIGKVAPFAAQAGVSIDELLASVAALTKGGVQTNVAMTGLRAILAAITKPTSEAIDMAEQLGLQFDSNALSAKGLGVFLQEVAEKTGGATDKISQLFGGVEALVPVLAFAGQAGKDLSKIMQDMNVKAGATDTAFEKMSATIDTQLGRVLQGLKNKFLELALPLGNALVPALTMVADNLDHLIIAGTSLATLFAGKLALSLASAAIAAVMPTVRMLSLAASISASSLAATLASTAFKLLGRVLLTVIPAALMIAAGELVSLLFDLKEKTGSWGTAFSLVGDVALGVLKDIWANLKALGNGFVSFYAGIAQGAVAFLKGGSFKEAFLEAFKDIEFGAMNTTEAIARMNAALQNPGSSGASADGAAAGDSSGASADGAGGPSQDVLDKYHELITSLEQQTLAMGMSERAAAIYSATIQLADGSTAEMKSRVEELAGALFDATANHEAAKATAESYKQTVDELSNSIGMQLDSLYKTDEQIAIDNALKKVNGKLTDEQIKQLTTLAKNDAVLKNTIAERNKLEKAAADVKAELMTKQDKLNQALREYQVLLAGGFISQTEFDAIIVKVKKDLNIDTRSIGQRMWDGLKATFFDPFKDGAEDMADKFAEQVERMSAAADRMSSAKGILDKIQGANGILSNILGPIGQVSGTISNAISVVKSVVNIVKSIGTVLFGGKWQTTGGGIQLQLGAAGVLGQSFEDQHKKGGLFSSSKDRTIFSGISNEQQTQYNAAYNAILDNATNAFKLFGMKASRDIMESVQIAALNIKTSGEGALSESEAKAAIENWFKQLDSAVVTAVGGATIQPLLDLATEGEAASETLIRLGNQMNVTNALLASVNVSMYDVGVNGAVLADTLVKMAGGIDTFTAGVDSFFRYFFTEDEQIAKLTENLTNTFDALGLILPETRQGVRDLVNGLDLTTEAGQRAFAAIMTSSEALNVYYTNLENISNDAADAVTQAALEAEKIVRKRTDNALDMLRQSINAEKSVKKSAYDESIKLIQSEGKARVDAANTSLISARQTLSALQGEVSQINNALASAQFQFNSSGSRQSSIALIRSALASGNFTGTGAAAQNISQLNASSFASAAAFQREQARTLNLLGELSDKGQDQIDYAQLTITTLENEIIAIQDSTSELIDVERILFDQQIELLDDQLNVAENQLNALRGIDASVMTVNSALQDFYTAIQAERANGGTPPGVTTTASTVSASQNTVQETVDALNRIADYSQATATASMKNFNLQDRLWRESQAEQTV